VELTGYQAKTGERLWWARGVAIAPATSPVIAGDSVYTMEPVLDAGGAPPFKDMLAQFDKNKTGTVELSEVKNAIMLRIFKSVDKNVGNNDGVVTEEEWMSAFVPKVPGGGLVRTRLDGKGDVSQTHVGWRHTKGLSYLATPILYEKVLYVVRDGGIVSSFDPETGKVLKEARLKDALGEYWAQPVAGDGKVYFVSKEGKVSVIRAGAEWEKLSTGDLDEQVIATPAIADGRVYIRTEGMLYCFGR
jgi:outer membrane protein assembly factor BamB